MPARRWACELIADVAVSMAERDPSILLNRAQGLDDDREHGILRRAMGMIEELGWRVYVLRCADGTLYTGITNCLAARIEAHNAGRGARYTRARLPVELVYEEPADNRAAALRREAQIKQLPAAAKRHLIGVAPTNGIERR